MCNLYSMTKNVDAKEASPAGMFLSIFLDRITGRTAPSASRSSSPTRRYWTAQWMETELTWERLAPHKQKIGYRGPMRKSKVSRPA